jgi:predicted RNA-binding Zn ribbon-like protein
LWKLCQAHRSHKKNEDTGTTADPGGTRTTTETRSLVVPTRGEEHTAGMRDPSGLDDRQPAGRDAAPGRLGVVQAFLNTLDVESGTESLDTTVAAGRWLLAAGLCERPPRIDSNGLDTLLGLREQLRDLAAANGSGSVHPATIDALNRIGQSARLTPIIDGDGLVRFMPAEAGLRGAVAQILELVHRTQLEGTWARLKCCPEHTCRWVFYDRSRNRSGTWCSMAVCGNRTKARTFRARRG